jgi:hypothetical protein
MAACLQVETVVQALIVGADGVTGTPDRFPERTAWKRLANRRR